MGFTIRTLYLLFVSISLSNAQEPAAGIHTSLLNKVRRLAYSSKGPYALGALSAALAGSAVYLGVPDTIPLSFKTFAIIVAGSTAGISTSFTAYLLKIENNDRLISTALDGNLTGCKRAIDGGADLSYSQHSLFGAADIKDCTALECSLLYNQLHCTNFIHKSLQKTGSRIDYSKLLVSLAKRSYSTRRDHLNHSVATSTPKALIQLKDPSLRWLLYHRADPYYRDDNRMNTFDYLAHHTDYRLLATASESHHIHQDPLAITSTLWEAINQKNLACSIYLINQGACSAGCDKYLHNLITLLHTFFMHQEYKKQVIEYIMYSSQTVASSIKQDDRNLHYRPHIDSKVRALCLDQYAPNHNLYKKIANRQIGMR